MVSPVVLATKSGRVFNKFWNTVKVGNHQNPLQLAESVSHIVQAAPQGRIFFRAMGSADMLKMEPSVLAVCEFVKEPAFQIHINRKGLDGESLATLRKATSALKNCLTAKNSKQSLQEANLFIDELVKEQNAKKKALSLYYDRLA